MGAAVHQEHVASWKVAAPVGVWQAARCLHLLLGGCAQAESPWLFPTYAPEVLLCLAPLLVLGLMTATDQETSKQDHMPLAAVVAQY